MSDRDESTDSDDDRDEEQVDPSDPPASWAMRTSDDGPEPHDPHEVAEAIGGALNGDETPYPIGEVEWRTGSTPDRVCELGADDRGAARKSRARRRYEAVGRHLRNLDRGDRAVLIAEGGRVPIEVIDETDRAEHPPDADGPEDVRRVVTVGYVTDAIDDRQTLTYRSDELWRARVRGWERRDGRLMWIDYGRLRAVGRIDGDDGPAVRV